MLTVIILIVGSPIVSFSQSPFCSWVNGYSTGGSEGFSLSSDMNGNIYSTGVFNDSIEVSSLTGDYTLYSVGWNSCVIQKMDKDGGVIWVKALTGLGYAFGYGIISDNLENVYIVGYFSGAIDFDPNSGDNTLNAVGAQDIFILKLDSNGDFVWVRALEGTGSTESQANSIALDSSNNIIIVGEYDGTMDFDGDIGVESKTSFGSTDIFVLKLDLDGNFVWVQAFEGDNLDNCYASCTDDLDNIFITGRFHGTVDFDPGVGIDSRTALSGFGDIFTVKLDQSGNLLWANTFGGLDNEFGEDVIVDVDGNVYTFGRFRATVDFDPSGTVNEITSAGNQDAFIQKVDPNGNLIWAKSFGGLYSAFSQSVALDSEANIYLCGFFSDTIDLDPGVGTAQFTALSSFSNGFVSKLDSSGNYIWGCSLQSISSVTPREIHIDMDDNVFVTGRFSETVDFDPTVNSLEMSSTYGSIFVVKYEEGFSGVESNDSDLKFRVYPNPTNSNLLFDYPVEKIRLINVYDMQGNTVASEVPESNSISFEFLGSGLYVIELITIDNEILTSKVTKN
ncbi:MAG: T9SS type A sorting domain-containing protein [Crocinitomicaceae bacterium]